MTSSRDIAQVKETQVPEWEHIAVSRVSEKQDITSTRRESIRTVLVTKLDSILPPNRKYIGLSRKALLWTLLAISLALLILIVGLAAGLSQKSRYARTQLEQ